MSEITLSKIAEFSGLTLSGEDRAVTGLAYADSYDGREGVLSFACAKPYLKKAIDNSEVSSIVSFEPTDAGKKQKPVLVSNDPAGDFYFIHNYLCMNTDFYSEYDFTAKIDNGCRIHPSAIIEDGVVIRKGVDIGPGVVIHKGSIIGENVRIGANTVVGAEGNATAYKIRGRLMPVHYAGGIEIGENTVVGANSLLSRNILGGRLLIGKFCHIDNCVHVGHNASVGDECILSAGTVVCGGARIGEKSYMAPKTLVRDKITLASGTRTHLGAVVVSDSAENEILAGFYAMPHSAFMMKLTDERRNYL